MAKEKKEKETKDVTPEGTEGEVQKPEKQKKNYSDLGLKSLLIIVVGSILVVVIVIFALYWFLIRPDILASSNGSNNNNPKQITKTEIVLDEETLKFNEALDVIKQNAKTGTLKDISFFQTQDIITNTNPPDWFVVLQIGVEYKDVLNPAAGGHGGEASLSPKLISEVSTVVTKFCGSRSMEAIIGLRDSLDLILFKELSPIFVNDKMYLHKISIPKFVTQRA